MVFAEYATMRIKILFLIYYDALGEEYSETKARLEILNIGLEELLKILLPRI